MIRDPKRIRQVAIGIGAFVVGAALATATTLAFTAGDDEQATEGAAVAPSTSERPAGGNSAD